MILLLGTLIFFVYFRGDLFMSSKFHNVPVEEGTRINFEQEIRIDEMDVLHQVWSWDGVHAESFVFQNNDTQSFNDDEVKKIVKDYLKDKLRNEAQMTISRSDSGFTFVNFNFTY